ncbi:hypothetical protein N9026_00220 [bacterium]|nr:hypothetical protein [bacterium]
MKLTITLTEEEVQQLQVLASKASYTDWKEFTKDEFHSKVMQQKIGTAFITATSEAKGGRVTGTSKGVSY